MERHDPLMRDRARELRKNQTEAEQKLWQAIKKNQVNGVKFRRQYCIGYYIVDFISLTYKLIIEVDGGQHLEKADYDIVRTEYLTALGYKVIRFWNNEIFEELDSVLESINNAIISLPPTLTLPRVRGRGQEESVFSNPLPRLRGRDGVGGVKK